MRTRSREDGSGGAFPGSCQCFAECRPRQLRGHFNELPTIHPTAEDCELPVFLIDRPCFMMIARSESGEEAGGEGGILPEHPRKFSVVMVKLKSFAVNERFVEKPFCQCHWKILGLGFRRKS